MSACSDHRLAALLGAYALGACPADEGRRMTVHLRTCHACASELAQLSSSREALLTVPAAVDPPAELKAELMRRVRADAELFAAAQAAPAPRARTRSRWRLRVPAERLLPPMPTSAVALALLLFTIAGVLVGRMIGTERTPPRTIAAEIDGRVAPRARAEIALDGHGERLTASDLPAPGRGRVYQVWLRSEREAPRPTDALFTIGAGRRVDVELPAAVRDADELLVTSEPAGGSPLPTRKPVLTALL